LAFRGLNSLSTRENSRFKTICREKADLKLKLSLSRPLRRRDGAEVKLHSVSASALDGGA